VLPGARPAIAKVSPGARPAIAKVSPGVRDGEDEDAGDAECDIELEAEAESEDVVVESEDQPSAPKKPSIAKRSPIANTAPVSKQGGLATQPSVAKVLPGARPAIAKVSPGARPAIAKVSPGVRPPVAKVRPWTVNQAVAVAKRPSFAAVAARPPHIQGKGNAKDNEKGCKGKHKGLISARPPQVHSARPPQVHSKGKAKGNDSGCKGKNKAVSADGWEEDIEISVPAPSSDRGGGKGTGVTQAQQTSAKGSRAKGASKGQQSSAKASQPEGPSMDKAKHFELTKKANDLAKKALLKVPEKEKEGKLTKLRNLFLKKLQEEHSKAQDKSSKSESSTGIAAKSKFMNAAKLRQATFSKPKVTADGDRHSSLKRKGTDASDDEWPRKRPDRKERTNDGTADIKATDPEGRKYDFDTIVVNMANVGASFAKKVLNKQKGLFDWEGVRRCVRFLKCDRKLKVIGVLNENFRGTDSNKFPQVTMPSDLLKMCASVEETPRLTGNCHSSADDEMTIKCAYRRNCRFLDNDNYRDWTQQLRDEKIRTWLIKCQDLLQMRYYFDKGLGTFDVLEGNIPAWLLAQGKTDVDKRELWTAKRA